MKKLSFVRLLNLNEIQQCKIAFNGGPTKRWNAANPQPLLPRRITTREEKDIKFVDRCRVEVFGGKGGNGMCCFSGRFLKPFAGPDGGNGGNGGKVRFEASKRITSLESVKLTYMAKNGLPGGSKRKTGKSGPDLVIKVPPRVKISSVGKCSNTPVHLLLPKQSFVGAEGGVGGRGNFAFLTSTERAPEIWEPGLAGEHRTFEIEMLEIANFALVGMPNVGKSSFLKAVSRAKPRVAEFPFTTLFPQIGVVDFEDSSRISVAEIPGLIKGASKNVGHGMFFLKHLCSCMCMAIMIDLTDHNPAEQLQVLKDEINHFDPQLFDQKPFLIVGNKIEAEYAPSKWAELKMYMETDPKLASCISIPISVTRSINIAKLLITMRRLLLKYQEFLAKIEAENELDV